MSRARDVANFGGGISASDITTGTLGNTVQDNITRLGTVTTGTLAGTVSGTFKAPTAQTVSSGTGVTFSSLPSYVDVIIISFYAVQLDGGSHLKVQIGDSGGLESSGYITGTAMVGATTGYGSYTDAFQWFVGNSARISSGHLILTNITSNTWIYSYTGKVDTDKVSVGGGRKDLSDTLTQVKVFPGGSNNFAGGTINIAYSG